METRRAILSLALCVSFALFVSPALAQKLPSKGSLRVNINTATELQLQSLPGVGPALAEAIVLKRPYRKVEELARVKGVSIQMVRDLRRLLTVNDPTGPAPKP